jgi:hypothetical protein
VVAPKGLKGEENPGWIPLIYPFKKHYLGSPYSWILHVITYSVEYTKCPAVRKRRRWNTAPLPNLGPQT